MRSIINSILLCTCSLLFITSNTFASNFADTYGFSAEGIARGNAMSAVVNDWSSVYYNVAGLGKTQPLKTGGKAAAGNDADMSLKLRKKKDDGSDAKDGKEIYPSQVTISCMYTFPQLNLNIQRYTGTTPIPTNAAKMDPYGFFLIGAAVDINVLMKLPKFISSMRLGVGIGLNSDATLAKINNLDPRTHNYMRYGREVQRAMILIGLGFGILDDFIGGGIGINNSFSGNGKVTMEGNITNTPQLPIQQAKMDLGIAPGAMAGIYISPGQLSALNVLQGLEIGASYRQETFLDIYPFSATALIASGAIDMNLYLAIFDYYQPHIITGGIAYTRWGLTISADVEYHMWSLFKASIAEKVNNYFYPQMMEQFFRDILVYKGGIKYRALSWLEIMAGYYYQPSILRGHAGKFKYNFMDNDKHVASAGLSFIVPKFGPVQGNIVIKLAYQFQYLVDKSTMKYDLAGVISAYGFDPVYSYGGMNHTAMIEVGIKL